MQVLTKANSIGSLNYEYVRYTLVKDLQGNVIGLADKNGNLAAKYTYDAWGNILSVTDGQGNDVSGNPGHIANVNPLRYRGYYFDQETGFYYLHTRYYDPMAGRFINADGYVTTDSSLSGANMFAYCKNNPVMMVDPDGNRPIWEILEEQTNTANSIIAATKPKKSVADKVLDTLWSGLKNFTLDAGFGSGFGGYAKISNINVDVIASVDMLHVRYAKGNLDIGYEERYGVNFSLTDHLGIGSTGGLFHSFLCKQYEGYPNPNHDIYRCSNSIKYDESLEENFEILGVGAYCIVGLSFSIGYNFGGLLNDIEQIWF